MITINFTKKITLLAIFFIITTDLTAAEKDGITLDSTYLSGKDSQNYSYSTFNYEWLRAGSRIADKISTNYVSESYRWLYYPATALTNQLIYASAETTYHEWGHYSRANALGVNNNALYPCDVGTKCDSYSSFFGLLSGRPTGGAYTTIGSNNYVGNSSSGPSLEAIVSGGGVNNQAYVTEKMDEALFLKEQSSLFQLPSMISNRLSIWSYGDTEDGKGDINIIAKNYKSSGLDDSSSASKLIKINTYSLLSGSTASGLLGIYNYLSNGTTTYKALSFYGFRIPDQNNYISSRGITRKISSGYEYSKDFKIIFGYEYVVKGQDFKEYEIGIYKKFKEWDLYLKSIIGDKNSINGLVTVSKQIGDNFKVTLNNYMWDSRSLMGERNSLKLSKDKTYQTTIGISYTY